MATSLVNVSTRYQVTIPKEVCSQPKIKTGDRLLLDIQDGLLIFLPLHGTFTHSLAGLDRKIWEDSEEHILRERNSWIDSTKP